MAVPALLLLALTAGSLAAAATGSAACSTCHAEIYRSYMRSPMATSSGRSGVGGFQENFDSAEFSHARSGVRYRVYREDRKTSFDFDLIDDGVRLHGSRRLEYFVGSGMLGRSYLFSIDGFLYQAPVSYYSSEHKWDLSPGYQNYDHLFLTRPVEVACLQCHASRLQPTAGTVNGFADVPFLEGGISCERCHGPGEEHISRAKSAIVNPRKLAPERRDSVCAQCHLAGAARVVRAGRDMGSFRPGDRLFDYVSVFIWSSAPAETKVTGHFEKLAQSRCKIESGDRLWCGSCHNPHTPPPEAEKANYFRGKCLECHRAADSCKASSALRARNSNDCIDCHMPKNPVKDVAHAVYSDHSIPRRAAAPARDSASSVRVLTPFGNSAASDRDLGLAYALVVEAERNTVYEARAFELLKAVVTPESNDIPAVVQLGHLYGYRSEEDKAIPLYEKAVSAEPSQMAAANNLAVYLVKRGRTSEAMRLWSSVLAQNPGFEIARVNLAVAQYRTGDSKSAQRTLTKALELNPGATAARRLLNEFRRNRAPMN